MASSLFELATGQRTVFYEALGEYGPRYLGGSALSNVRLKTEVDHHIERIKLLTLYFDTVLIQTAPIFNNNDRFIRSVVERLLSDVRFKRLMSYGLIRLCGWGGTTDADMFGSALEYASSIVAERHSQSLIRTISETFQEHDAIHRDEGKPDSEQADHFRNRMSETPLIGDQSAMALLEDAIDYSYDKVGGLTGLAVKHILDKNQGKRLDRRFIFENYFASWIKHLSVKFPNVYFYTDIENHSIIDLRITVNGVRGYAFLYSPQIFASFLMRFLSRAQYSALMQMPESKFCSLRNGDWAAFRDAYHAALTTTSRSLASVDIEGLYGGDMLSATSWAAEIAERAELTQGTADPSAFIQAIANIGSLFQFLPIINAVGSAVAPLSKKPISKNMWGHAMSPFIRKINNRIYLTA